LAAVDRNDRALIGSEEDGPRIVGIDPEAVVVVAAGRAAERRPRLPAVDRFPGDDVRDVDDVRILRIGADLVEVAVASPQPRVVVQAPPARAGVIGAIDAAALRGADDGVEPVAIRWRD